MLGHHLTGVVARAIGERHGLFFQILEQHHVPGPAYGLHELPVPDRIARLLETDVENDHRGTGGGQRLGPPRRAAVRGPPPDQPAELSSRALPVRPGPDQYRFSVSLLHSRFTPGVLE